MEIEFVNHASVILSHGNVRLLTDPWTKGSAFDDGWALLSPSRFDTEDYRNVTHIWFSHEHPDHFSVPTLNSIPEEVRRNIHVLYQRSEDKKVVEFCRKLGFGAVTELDLGVWTEIAPDFNVLCDRWGQNDSWLLAQTPDARVLNLNDCILETESKIATVREQVGEVDVLLTQFSISAWDGNVEDVGRRRGGAEAMVDRAVLQARMLDAKFVVPFASFIWFCHEENDYMNSELFGVGEVASRIESGSNAKAVVLYPGDVWPVGTAPDCEQAIKNYEADARSLDERPRIASEPVSLETLSEAARHFSERVSDDVSPLRLRLRAVKLNAMHMMRTSSNRWWGWVRALVQICFLRVRPARVWLTDHEASVSYCLIHGLRRADFGRSRCDIELSSSALSFAFKYLWGGETLQVNGRFREMYPEGRIALFDYFWLAAAMNHEQGALAVPLAVARGQRQ